MHDVKVRVYEKGTLIAEIERPLRAMPDGTAAVTFRRQLHPLVNGAIHLGAPPPDTPLPGAPPEQADAEEVGPGEWHRAQRAVIEAGPHVRLVVDAGPGTGKTQVACARVVYLIGEVGLNPSAIWLISFTRTAVAEMRSRIAGARGEATAVRIATLDAHAWSLHSGFDERASLTGSHDTNIEQALELIRSDELLADHLETVEHLIVDEAQDLVGVRAELISALIDRLPRECGVTVLADEAQAIYGFADGGEQASAPRAPATLLQRLQAVGFERRPLTKVFRTASVGLLHIFQSTRACLLSATPVTSRLAQVREDIVKHADSKVPAIEKQALAGAADTLVLFRRRVEVLLASSFLMNAQTPVRVRMSGLPSCLYPWLGICLSDHHEPFLSRTVFRERWQHRIRPDQHTEFGVEAAWSLLVEIAGKSPTIVEMRRLRAILGRARPPAVFCTSEVGTVGPILGTIHASKGREARVVHLMLPGDMSGDSEVDLEEARVLFVGATRAREHLGIGKGYAQRAAELESGRAYHIKPTNGRAQIEIGHDGDVTPMSMVGSAVRASAVQAQEVQENIQGLQDFPLRVEAVAGVGPSYRYQLQTIDTKQALGSLSDRVNKDLHGVCAAIQRKDGGPRHRPPGFLSNIFIMGIRTMVLPPDHPTASELHEPWQRSGFLLAPIVLAYTTMLFPCMLGE